MTVKRSSAKFLYYLSGLTLAGFLLRINHTWSESITADEVSALLRLQFDSLAEMIQKGVRPDGHPAFTQVLLWFWTKIFGNSEFAVRLPFVLMGTASIWLAGQAARRWFGIGTAIAVAAGMAFLELPLMYSQLARPYAPGLFFTMWAAASAARFSSDDKVKWIHVLSFAIAAAGAAYSHYFSLLTVLLLGVAGVFLASRTNAVKFLLGCLAAILLFLPHLSITIAQLEIGGVGGPQGWLGPPTPDFFWSHIIVMFDSSRPMTYILLAVLLFCLVFNKRWPDRKQWSMLLIWLLPLLIGYCYSVYKNPVLQHSVLLFSFPFLLFFIFSWFPNDEEVKYPYRFGNAIIVLLAVYITCINPFRLTDHFGRLKELVEVYNRYDDKGATAVFNVDDPYFINYYTGFSRTKVKKRYPFTFLSHGETNPELRELRDRVIHSQGDYFIYGWSSRGSSPASLDIIAQEYPCLVEKHEWYNSAVYVFARQNQVPEKECAYHSNMLYYSFMNIRPADTTQRAWHATCGIEGEKFTLDSFCQFSPMIRLRVGDVMYNPDNELMLHASVFMPRPRTNCVMVMEFFRNNERLLWSGMETKTQLDTTRVGWQIAYFGQRPPVRLMKSDSIHAYLYTPALEEIQVRNVTFMTREGHRGIHGQRPDFE